MKVVKRDGSLEDFDRLRIFRVVLGAMREVGQIDERAANQVTDEVVKILYEKGDDRVHAEDTQEFVELSLMRYGLYDVAKA